MNTSAGLTHRFSAFSGIGHAAAGALKALTFASLATVVAVLLFRFDSMLISQPKNYDKAYAGAKIVDFVRVEQEEFTRMKQRRIPKKPPPPDRPPPPPKMQMNTPQDIPTSALNIDLPDIEMNFGAGGGPYLGQWYGRSGPNAPDSDVVPIVRISPRYPRQALLQGVEGWVEIEFTITAEGRVIDPVVVVSEPRKVFDRNAIQAILRWKFKPRFIDGEPITRRAVQTIVFELDS
ncbi:MAG: energy transducer TonB [Gammaproteobacteria bacterium]|nr:MAG: energy transducer TonB [Gammaproteobacteria bacterium]